MKLDPGFICNLGGIRYCPDCGLREVDRHARGCPRLAAWRLLRRIADAKGSHSDHQRAAERLLKPSKG